MFWCNDIRNAGQVRRRRPCGTDDRPPRTGRWSTFFHHCDVSIAMSNGIAAQMISWKMEIVHHSAEHVRMWRRARTAITTAVPRAFAVRATPAPRDAARGGTVTLNRHVTKKGLPHPDRACHRSLRPHCFGRAMIRIAPAACGAAIAGRHWVGQAGSPCDFVVRHARIEPRGVVVWRVVCRVRRQTMAPRRPNPRVLLDDLAMVESPRWLRVISKAPARSTRAGSPLSARLRSSTLCSGQCDSLARVRFFTLPPSR